MSVVIHEVAHGFMAERWGDKTARYAGRLTLNPLKHLDPFGSVILPVLLYISSGFAFGWAKPVPYNPDNLSDRKWGTFWVAAAGVLVNLFIAVLFGIIYGVSIHLYESHPLPSGFYFIVSSITMVNLALAIFNLIPIPPLDGSKILFALLPRSFYRVLVFLESYGFFLLIIFIVFFSQYLEVVLSYSFAKIVGLAFLFFK